MLLQVCVHAPVALPFGHPPCSAARLLGSLAAWHNPNHVSSRACSPPVAATYSCLYRPVPPACMFATCNVSAAAKQHLRDTRTCTGAHARACAHLHACPTSSQFAHLLHCPFTAHARTRAGHLPAAAKQRALGRAELCMSRALQLNHKRAATWAALGRLYASQGKGVCCPLLAEWHST